MLRDEENFKEASRELRKNFSIDRGIKYVNAVNNRFQHIPSFQANRNVVEVPGNVLDVEVDARYLSEQPTKLISIHGSVTNNQAIS